MKKIVIFIIGISLIILAIFSNIKTNAKFVSSSTLNEVVNMVVDVDCSEDIGEVKEFNVSSNNSDSITFNISSSSQSSLNYGIYYKLISPNTMPENVEVGQIRLTANDILLTSGTITNGNTITVPLAINNNSDTDVIIQIGILVSDTTITYDDGEIYVNSIINYTKPEIQNVYTFDYTGSAQEWTAPVTGTYKIELWGADIQSTLNCAGTLTPSKTGAYTSGTINLNKNKKLYIYVGGQGLNVCSSGTGGAGWNGGGTGTYGTYGSYGISKGGAGATDVRTINGEWNNGNSLISRIMVASGAANGSYAGGLFSNDSTPGINKNSNYSPYYGTGATQTLAGYHTFNNMTGAFGVGGKGEEYVYGYGSIGGGSGWYGGSGNISQDWNGSGNRYQPGYATGGSSYISGHTGCVTVKSISDSTPKTGCTTGTSDNACSVHPNGNVFSNTKMIDGLGYAWTNEIGEQEQMPNPLGGYYDLGVGHSGNGYAKITYISNQTNQDPDLMDIYLPEGMIPVKYDGTTLVKADVNNTNNDWFNYDSKLWANAILVTSETRDTYMNTKQVGDAITESDVLAYYVWIPRYKYKLWNTTFTTSSPQEIDIVFETVNDPISNGSTNGEYLSHPAFWWDNDSDGSRETGEELSGIWIGKFETSSDATCTAANYSVGTACDITTLSPRILPNITSWRGIRPSTMYSVTKKIESATYLTSNGVNQIDSHMMKNMEWGAVAYLSHSKYGKNSEITINDNSSNLTGGGAYKTNIAQSTTGNITGIYDMSSGTYEYVMGVVQDNTNTMTPMSGNSTTYNSGFTGKLYDSGNLTQYTGTSFPAKKYYDLYAYGTTTTDQTAYNRSHLGDATGETRGWYSDYIRFVYANYPWVYRSGYYNSSASAGVFAFNNNYGHAHICDGFRSVITNIK